MDEVIQGTTPDAASRSLWFENMSILAQHPGRLMELIEREFVVTSPWPDLGPQGISGRPVLSGWSVGTHGIVTCLMFDGRCWLVQAELQGDDFSSRRGLEHDEIYPEIPLQHFVRCTAPKGQAVAHHLVEVANDA